MDYNIVAIEREYASGGSEIGEKLAEKLGIPCYGYEILQKAAEKLNLLPERLIEIEENINGSLLISLITLANVMSCKEGDLLMIERRLALVESEIIRDLSMRPCVLIGRGAAALLNHNVKALKVFIHADIDARIKRSVSTYGLAPKQAEAVIQRNDKRRSNYFKATTEKAWKDPDIYHMLLNSGKLGIDQTVDIIYSAVSAR